MTASYDSQSQDVEYDLVEGERRQLLKEDAESSSSRESGGAIVSFDIEISQNNRSSLIVNASSRPWQCIDSMEHSFNPSIEGLRGIAALMTMICHIKRRPKAFSEVIGMTGVTIFFVLSGFLITGVLSRMQSKSQSLYGHLSRFYADRFVRLGPALMVMVSITYIIHLRLGHDTAWLNTSAICTLFYVTNWRSLHPGWYWSTWDNTWSLACEEQFYIMWSLALPYIVARGPCGRRIILASSIGFFLFVRFYVSLYPGAFFGIDWHFGLWANIWKMLVGASFRLLPVPGWIFRRRYAFVGLLGLFAVLVSPYFPQPNYQVFPANWRHGAVAILTWTDLFTAVSTLFILAGIHSSRGGISILEDRSLRFLGRVSYSWYLWQYSVIVLSDRHELYAHVSDTATALVLAMCSTFWIEEPLSRRYKSWKTKRSETSLPT